jgi:AcrR family transcriptional regulator
MNQISRAAITPRRKDARIERTRIALRTALLHLLDDRSFDQITIRDICARASTGYATYFRHYPDKHALLNDLAAVEVAELLKRALPILFSVDSYAACVTLCGYVDQNRELWSALLTGGASGTLREEFARQSQQLAKDQPPSARPQSRVPADLAVAFGVSGVVEILTWWLQHPKAFTLDQIADILNRLVIAPILHR